ncbi:VanW family protein [Paenibacillus sp. YYML68]|uniref:VanW family protein n=1 Tax=Paenibacillus sp. YYML68 TaxID=2909250 RepID=UPI002493A989|nr:VanW family protein [Paenibacillus sp. YYML68]
MPSMNKRIMPRGAFRVIAPLLTCALGLTLVGSAAVWVYASTDRIPSGVQLDGWPVGGLPYAELDQQLQARKQQYTSLPVQLQLAGSGDSTASPLHAGELGVSLQEDELRARIARLQTGSLYSRARARWSERGQRWSVQPQVDTAQLQAALRQSFPASYRSEPKDAVRTIRADDTVVYTPETTVLRPDEQRFADELLAALPRWTEAGAVQEPLRLQVPERQLLPKQTLESLRAQGITRRLAAFTTVYPPAPSTSSGGSSSSAGRVHNVRSTAATLHDVLLAPGDVFDYAPIVERTEQRAGYREAPVIMNGKLVPGIGGGICQVSSTLYNAVLRAGLEIVERRNHSLPVSYVPLGQDATFSSGYINFKFRNNTEHYVLVRTEADEERLTVKLFGQTPEELTYEVESKTIETLEPPRRYVHNPKLRPGQEQVLAKGKPGYIVETYRIHKRNGSMINREKLSRDTYAAQSTLVAVNGGPDAGSGDAPAPSREEGAAPHVEDGVKGPSFR